MMLEDSRDNKRLRLIDENEQLRTALESSLEENARLAEDRDRLLTRVTVLARELQTANSAYNQAPAGLSEREETASEARQSQADEELRVAFEELQVLTEELEAANTTLQLTNAQLEMRIEERTRTLAETNDALRRSEMAFRTLVDGMPQLAWRSEERGGWTWASQQWCAFTGQTFQQALGDGWMLALHPDDRAAARHAWAHASPARPLQFEMRIYHVSEGRHRHFQTRAAAALGEDGKVMEWLGTSTDIDELMQLQHRQGVLVDELQHRTRNLMAVVQAVVLRTVKGSKSLDEFRRCIDDRMQALARAQGLLSRRGSGHVMFDALLHEELSAHVELDAEGRADQVTTHGPPGIPLPSSIVQTYALALHELATNATKYGALASREGRLDVRWEVVSQDGASRLRVNWAESGVTNMPDVSSGPQGGGYGRELIERALPYQLGAQTSYRIGEDGVHCTIEVPLGDTGSRSDSRS